ncbi:MAG: GGDEF domain-containing protein [Clostridia bacterium]|nr:GGDEF domain-containing protein [Clostridia bacterium]
MKEILLENFVFLYELIGLFILLNIGVYLSERIKKMTKIAILLIALETVFFCTEKWTQTFERLSLLRPMMTASLYSIYPIILIVLMQIASYHTFSKKNLLLLLIPEFICVPLFFTSQWTHLIFYFHESNHYSGGIVPGLSFLPYYLFGFYVVVFFVRMFAYFKASHQKNRWFILAYIAFVPVFGVIFYRVVDSGKDYNALFLSSILLYYVYIYFHMSKTDSLTSLLNRQSYYKALQTDSQTITGVVSVDMNELKRLNDNFGHQEGDTALLTVAAIMREHCGRGGVVYRVGGDEFMILYSGVKESEIVDSIALMKEKMAETNYMCAFGYAMKQPDMSISDTIRESDRKMYQNKALMKSKKNS